MILIDNKPIYTDYIKLENQEQFLAKVPLLHPDDPRYILFWSKEFKKCIEGTWGKMFDGYRYMPGKLYFYKNYFLIQDTDANKQTKYVRPRTDDIEWEFAYMSLEAHGFSGFEFDDEYTSLEIVKELVEVNDFVLEKFPEVVNPHTKKLKTYIPPRENIKKLHDKPLGRAYMRNPTWNEFILGTRGGGKSFTAAAEIEHGIIFDGTTIYNSDFIKGKLTAEFIVGSADSDKSSELCNKVRTSIEAKANPNFRDIFGIWGNPGDDDFTPSPLFKDMTGSLVSPNKKNPYRHEYKVQLGGRWVTKGTNSKLFHVNYSSKKGDGAQAAAGGRYLKSIIEETGLLDNVIEVHTSNDSTIARDGVRFGVERYQGTSGNIEYIQASKKMFLNPKDYRILSFYNHHGNEGANKQVGFFLPFYMVLRQFKDKDGNTDYTKAAEYVNKIRKEKQSSTNPDVLREEKMNRPCFIEEMWVNAKGYLLPYDEASVRERELMEYDRYKALETPVELIWDSNSVGENVINGVRYKINHNVEPYRDYPIDPSKRKSPNGCIVIYEFPKTIDGKIPNDMYMFVGHDPYVEEDLDRGGSVGSTYIIMNPKYAAFGFNGNTIVASYIDKPIGGLDEYYENQEKLLQMYGNPMQGLCIEKNRGQDCRAHYIKKNKTYLLMPSPQREQGTNIYQKNIVSYGYNVGNRIVKLQLAKMMNGWLLEETTLNDGTKKNIERIPCLYLLRQIMAYDLDGNFDAVDGFRGCIVALREYENRQYSQTLVKQANVSTFNNILKNRKIFKHGKERTRAYTD
jgi:hypothetical protein